MMWNNKTIHDLKNHTSPILGRVWSIRAKKRLAQTYAKTNSLKETGKRLHLDPRTVKNRLNGLDDMVAFYSKRLAPPLKITPILKNSFPAWVRNSKAGETFVWHIGNLTTDLKISKDLTALFSLVNKAIKNGLVTLCHGETCYDGLKYTVKRLNQHERRGSN